MEHATACAHIVQVRRLTPSCFVIRQLPLAKRVGLEMSNVSVFGETESRPLLPGVFANKRDNQDGECIAGIGLSYVVVSFR